MAWKIERWLADVYKDIEDQIEEYSHLPARELVIVACAILDVALAELLSARLVDDPAESADFLGADEDGRAPAGTFGARIQLAYLAGVLPKRALAPMRALKNLRNIMAHRVNVSLLDARAQKQFDVLRPMAAEAADAVLPQSERGVAFLRELAAASRTDESAARMVVLVVFCAIHHGLYHTLKSIQRIAALPGGG